METLRIAEPLNIARDRLAEEGQHLPHGEGHAHTMWAVRVARDEAPELPERDDRLENKNATRKRPRESA